MLLEFISRVSFKLLCKKSVRFLIAVQIFCLQLSWLMNEDLILDYGESRIESLEFHSYKSVGLRIEWLSNQGKDSHQVHFQDNILIYEEV